MSDLDDYISLGMDTVFDFDGDACEFESTALTGSRRDLTEEEIVWLQPDSGYMIAVDVKRTAVPSIPEPGEFFTLAGTEYRITNVLAEKGRPFITVYLYIAENV